jgi:hypothetical protein
MEVRRDPVKFLGGGARHRRSVVGSTHRVPPAPERMAAERGRCTTSALPVEELLADRTVPRYGASWRPQGGVFDRWSRDRGVACDSSGQQVTGHGLPALDGAPVVRHEMHGRIWTDCGHDRSHVCNQNGQGIVRSRPWDIRGPGAADVVGNDVELGRQGLGDRGPRGAGVGEAVDEDDSGERRISEFGYGQLQITSVNPSLHQAGTARSGGFVGRHLWSCTTCAVSRSVR